MVEQKTGKITYDSWRNKQTREVKAEDRAIKMNSDLANMQLEYDKLKITKKLSELRKRSIGYLEQSLMVN